MLKKENENLPIVLKKGRSTVKWKENIKDNLYNVIISTKELSRVFQWKLKEHNSQFLFNGLTIKNKERKLIVVDITVSLETVSGSKYVALINNENIIYWTTKFDFIDSLYNKMVGAYNFKDWLNGKENTIIDDIDISNEYEENQF